MGGVACTPTAARTPRPDPPSCPALIPDDSSVFAVSVEKQASLGVLSESAFPNGLLFRGKLLPDQCA